MKVLCLSMIGAILLLAAQPRVAADVIDAVKVYPKKGEPVVLQDFYMPWGHKVEARWNNQHIEVRVADIRTVKVVNIHPDDKFEYEVEMTFLKGNRAVMRIKDFCPPCEGDAPSGFLKIRSDDIKMLDLRPEQSLT